MDVGNKSQPVQIVQHPALDVAPGALAVVIFDAQQDSPAERARQSPDVDRVHDMPEVQRASRRRSEPRQPLAR